MKVVNDKQLRVGDKFGLFRISDKKWVCIAKKVKSPIFYKLEKGHSLDDQVIKDVGYDLYNTKYIKYLIQTEKDYLFITKHIILNRL